MPASTSAAPSPRRPRPRRRKSFSPTCVAAMPKRGGNRAARLSGRMRLWPWLLGVWGRGGGGAEGAAPVLGWVWGVVGGGGGGGPPPRKGGGRAGGGPPARPGGRRW